MDRGENSNLVIIDKLNHHLNRANAIVGFIQEWLPDNQHFDSVKIVVGIGREELEACQRCIDQLEVGSTSTS